MTEDNVYATALQLPSFWVEDPDSWFTHVEAQFAIKKITQNETKYSYIIAKMEPAALRRIKDITKAGPVEGAYEKIKKRLCTVFDLTDQERARQMFEHQGLGDQKPSELMAHFLSLTEGKDIEFVVKQLFLRNLPQEIRCTLANEPGTPIELATKADGIWATVNQTASVHAIAGPSSTTPQVCRYHKRWGDKARKCFPKCPKWKIFQASKKSVNEVNDSKNMESDPSQ